MTEREHKAHHVFRIRLQDHEDVLYHTIPKPYQRIDGKLYENVEAAVSEVRATYAEVYRGIPDFPQGTIGPVCEREYVKHVVYIPRVVIEKVPVEA